MVSHCETNWSEQFIKTVGAAPTYLRHIIYWLEQVYTSNTREKGEVWVEPYTYFINYKLWHLVAWLLRTLPTRIQICLHPVSGGGRRGAGFREKQAKIQEAMRQAGPHFQAASFISRPRQRVDEIHSIVQKGVEAADHHRGRREPGQKLRPRHLRSRDMGSVRK